MGLLNNLVEPGGMIFGLSELQYQVLTPGPSYHRLIDSRSLDQSPSKDH
jgi:hypothetical protein